MATASRYKIRGPSTLALVAAAKAGDRAAFDALIRRYRHGVYALCLDRTGNFDTAEDLTQEALLQAHAQLHTLREPAAFPGWLRQIARNVCRMWQRRPLLGTVAVEPEAYPQLTQDVYREALRREAAREVRAALAQLPENNRIAFLMHVQGSSYREIAEFIDAPETTVVGRLHRARSRLRTLLRERIRDAVAGETLPGKERGT